MSCFNNNMYVFFLCIKAVLLVLIDDFLVCMYLGCGMYICMHTDYINTDLIVKKFISLAEMQKGVTTIFTSFTSVKKSL